VKIEKRLRYLRDEGSYDLEEMAAALGVKSYTIRRYESDDRKHLLEADADLGH